MQARETFVRALNLEIQKRGNIIIPFISNGSTGMKTLEASYQNPVTVTSKYGTHDYEVPRVKFDNSLTQDTEKRGVLSYVLYKHPLKADTLKMSWDSLLIEKSIKVNTGVRLSTIDLLKRTSTVYSPDNITVLKGDSLLSRYLGHRCEVEATGMVCYNWWQVLDVEFPIVISLFLWLCFFLLFIYYERIVSFLRRRFVKKVTIIREKTIVVERKMHSGEVVEKTGLYELADGTILDSVKGSLSNGESVQQVQPQTVILLKFLLSKEDCWLTEGDITKELWGEKGNSNQFHVAIHRLREVLKDVSSDVTVVHKKGRYCLKISHSIEKNPDKV